MVRNAVLGTASTCRRSATWTSTSAFIPGLSRCPRLKMFTSTGNIVTFCCTWAWGSILSTLPVKGRFG